MEEALAAGFRPAPASGSLSDDLAVLDQVFAGGPCLPE
jgi:hypothetical protein